MRINFVEGLAVSDVQVIDDVPVSEQKSAAKKAALIR
jgi:hypothetical protein